MKKQIVPPTKWTNLTAAQREEIKKSYLSDGWKMEELQIGTWDQIEERLPSGTVHKAWAVNFNTRIKLK